MTEGPTVRFTDQQSVRRGFGMEDETTLGMPPDRVESQDQWSCRGDVVWVMGCGCLVGRRGKTSSKNAHEALSLSLSRLGNMPSLTVRLLGMRELAGYNYGGKGFE